MVDELIYYTFKCEPNTSFWQKLSSIDQTDFMVSITISQLKLNVNGFLFWRPSHALRDGQTKHCLSFLSISVFILKLFPFIVFVASRN